MAVTRVKGAVRRGGVLRFFVDGQAVQAHEGETIASAVLLSGRMALRYTASTGEPRGVFCGMGICFDCMVVVDGCPGFRACVTPVKEGVNVELKRAGDHD